MYGAHWLKKSVCRENYHDAIVGFDFGFNDDDELENDHLIICRLLASSALVYKFTNSIISLKPDNPYLHRTHTLWKVGWFIWKRRWDDHNHTTLDKIAVRTHCTCAPNKGVLECLKFATYLILFISLAYNEPQTILISTLKVDFVQGFANLSHVCHQ